MRAALRALASLIAGAGLILSAQAAGAADINAAVPGHGGVTYFDLIKLMITDLAPGKDGAAGHTVVPFTHVEGRDYVADLGSDDIAIGSVDVMPIPGDGSHLILMADLGPSDGNVESAVFLLLIAFDPTPRLMDVVEVGTDRFTGMGKTPSAMLAPGVPLIEVDSGHFNSNESFGSTELIFVRDGKFRLIDSVFTFGVSFCAYQRTQQLITTAAKTKGPYRAIRLRVQEATTLTGEDGCTDQPAAKPGVRNISTTYRWNARKGAFVADSNALQRLGKERERSGSERDQQVAR